MCFSATASFGASGVLLIIGAVSILKANGMRQLPFAVIPLIFAIQQFTEGLLWLSLERAYPGNEGILTRFYLFFAEVMWPVWIPLCFLWLEHNTTRRRILKVLSGAGFLVAGYMAYCLMTYEVQSLIAENHIKYFLDYPRPLHGYGNLLYGLATVVPAFVSKAKGMEIFGLLVLVSYLVSFIYFRDSLISVWCFFAAVISISVWFLLPATSQPGEVRY
ncbi:DUF6629 family protein [Salinimicrobium flavum]|uniref:DUF6629 family protein n=1 Tax=Salinimicrobium flavum TaxID=1737065 RepID=A0ABW5IZ30_9FLAO